MTTVRPIRVCAMAFGLALIGSAAQAGPPASKSVGGAPAQPAAEVYYVGDGKGKKGLEELIRFRGIQRAEMNMVPASQQTFRLTAAYGARIIPGSLYVRLNNQDITDRFSSDRGEETVELPLRTGNNRIDFWAATLVNGSEEHESDSIYVFRSESGSPLSAGAIPAEPPKGRGDAR